MDRRAFIERCLSVLTLGSVLVLGDCKKEETVEGFGNEEKLWDLASGKEKLEEPVEISYAKKTPALFRDASILPVASRAVRLLEDPPEDPIESMVGPFSRRQPDEDAGVCCRIWNSNLHRGRDLRGCPPGLSYGETLLEQSDVTDAIFDFSHDDRVGLDLFCGLFHQGISGDDTGKCQHEQVHDSFH